MKRKGKEVLRASPATYPAPCFAFSLLAFLPIFLAILSLLRVIKHGKVNLNGRVNRTKMGRESMSWLRQSNAQRASIAGHKARLSVAHPPSSMAVLRVVYHGRAGRMFERAIQPA